MEYRAWHGLLKNVQDELDHITDISMPKLDGQWRHREKLKSYSLVRELTHRSSYVSPWDSYSEETKVRGRYRGTDNTTGKTYNFCGKEIMDETRTRVQDPSALPTVFALIKREQRRMARWLKRQKLLRADFILRQKILHLDWESRERTRIEKLEARYQSMLLEPRIRDVGRREAWFARIQGYMKHRIFKWRVWQQRKYRFKWYDMDRQVPLVPCILANSHPRWVSNSCIHCSEWTRPVSVPILIRKRSESSYYGETETSLDEVSGYWVRQDLGGANNWNLQTPDAEDILSAEEVAKAWEQIEPKAKEIVNVPLLIYRSGKILNLLSQAKTAATSLVRAGSKWNRAISASHRATNRAFRQATHAEAVHIKVVNNLRRAAERVARSKHLDQSQKEWFSHVYKAGIARSRETVRASWAVYDTTSRKYASLRSTSAMGLLKSTSNAELLKRFGIDLSIRELSKLVELLDHIEHRTLPKQLEKLLRDRGVPRIVRWRSKWSTSDDVYHRSDWNYVTGHIRGTVTETQSYGDTTESTTRDLDGYPPIVASFTGADYGVHAIKRQRKALQVFLTYDFVDRLGHRIDDSIVYRGLMLDAMCLNGNLKAFWEGTPYTFCVNWVVLVREHLRNLELRWMAPKVSIQDVWASVKTDQIAQANPVTSRQTTSEDYGEEGWSSSTTEIQIPMQRKFSRMYVRRPLSIDWFKEAVKTSTADWLRWPSFSNGVTTLELWAQRH